MWSTRLPIYFVKLWEQWSDSPETWSWPPDSQCGQSNPQILHPKSTDPQEWTQNPAGMLVWISAFFFIYMIYCLVQAPIPFCRLKRHLIWVYICSHWDCWSKQPEVGILRASMNKEVLSGARFSLIRSPKSLPRSNPPSNISISVYNPSPLALINSRTKVIIMSSVCITYLPF
jgi:hypothetical protein